MTSRHDDIPALYSELSRDDSIIQLPAEFQQSQESSSSNQSLHNRDSATMKENSNLLGDVKTTSDATEETEDLFEGSKPVEDLSKAPAEEMTNTENIEEFDSENQEESMSLLKKAKLRDLKNKRYEHEKSEPSRKSSDPKEGTEKTRSPLRRKRPLRLRGDDPGEKVESLSVQSVSIQPQSVKGSLEMEENATGKIQFDAESESGSATEEDVIESSQVTGEKE